MKKILLILGIAAILLVGGVFLMLSTAGSPDDITINNVDLTNVENGTYYGEYATALVTAKVKVEVVNSQLASIEILEHNCGKGQPAEVIVDDVVDAQSLNVDTISGATMSSKVILKAVENAFSN